MSYAALRGRIRTMYGTQEAFAEDLGMAPTTLSAKLNARTDWTRTEIEKACQLLDIPPEEIPAYFFTP